MLGAKKFGTFGGVFTPAILTILGVIMYLRLPWIVGQAGLYSTVGIILVAHIISITTGLSVSSIATDKRVKTGGTYYMISRSLGLPIGGTLGLALFIGLSFSVSLYLIGFSESFLGFWGIEVTKNTIRLAGSIALLLVTIITFISTSLALKTQFFILLAIILSLASIFLGQSPEVPVKPLLTPIAGAAPFIVLFGIFFPAVTGFEAGVSMSGDLQNPKKSIPIGSVFAIVVGLVVYIGMAVFLSYRVSSDQLVNNSNVLLEISFFSPLVLAGIWGATVSSALGSILGAPRILQAISIDKITPKFFGVGFGKENEPRNALLLTFIIAEAGILVGELDVIARVVSMFFITTYGVLNLSCAIENWASPDFRPEFRVSKWISILGSATCVIVMIQLDLVAMFAATILLSALFFYLKRKELTLESGDTWEGVWSSIIRAGLDYLNQGKMQQRNWRPNIILFSGGSSTRPHLLSLGRRLVDKRGLLSNFDLIEVAGSKTLFSKAEQAIKKEDESSRGIFARRVECEDVYSAMETISKFYGFSGLEPNTVMMGWGRNSQQPEKLVHVLKTISDLDYNLMLLSYDESKGFGNHRQIDVWWRGMGNMIVFACSLCRFLTSSDEWQNATIRFLMITDHSALTERLHQVMNQVIDDYRLDAVVKVINNAVEQKPFYDIIKQESKHADLIINGIPNIQSGEESLYVTKTSTMIDSLGTVLLIRASSFFQDSYSQVALEGDGPVLKDLDSPSAKPSLEIKLPDIPTAAVGRLDSLLITVHRHFEKEILYKLHQTIKTPVEIFSSATFSCLDEIEKQFPQNERPKNQRLVARLLGDLLFQLQKRISDYAEQQANYKNDLLAEGINWVITRVDSIPTGLPEQIKMPRSESQLRPSSGDSLKIKLDKLGKRLRQKLFKKQAESTIRFRSLSEHHLLRLYREEWLKLLNDFSIRSLQLYTGLQRNIDKVVDSLGKIHQQLITKPEQNSDTVMLEIDQNRKAVAALTAVGEQRLQETVSLLDNVRNRTLERLLEDLNRFDSHFRLQKDRKARREAAKLQENIKDIPNTWMFNHQLMTRTLIADLILLSFKNRVTTIVRRAKGEISLSLENNLLDDIDQIADQLNQPDLLKESKSGGLTGFKTDTGILGSGMELAEEIRAIVADLPESAESAALDSIQSLSDQVPETLQIEEIPLRQRVEFFFESKFLGPLDNELNQLSATLDRLMSTGAEVVRLVSLGLTQANSGGSESEQAGLGSLDLIIKDSLARLEEAKKTASKTRDDFEQTLDRLLQDTLESLNLYSLAASADQLDHALKGKKEIWLYARTKKRIISLTNQVINLSTNLLYQQSSLSAARKNTSLLSTGEKSPVDHLLGFVESVSPRPGIVSSLPFYYRHLFLGKPVITKEFWVGRTSELQRASRSIKRFKEGKAGGLAVIGNPGSGKTALCHMIAGRQFEKQKIFTLTPPEGGSGNLDLFERKLKELLAIDSHELIIPERWPKNSVLILDDIGRWWRRAENGYQVIIRIKELIRQIGDRCLVILNANITSFQVLNQLLDMERYLLDIITCEAFDIRSLQEIILVRHRSTGLKFKVKNKNEDELSRWRMARLFTRCLGECAGNVGFALKKWIRCIQTVDKEKIDLSEPEKPELNELSYLESDQLLLITQLLLHTRLTRTALSEIMQLDMPRLKNDLEVLQRAGIINLSRNEMIELNLFVADYLSQYLRTKGII